MKDLIFRNLHNPKHETLKKSRRVIFALQYFPYVSKGGKINKGTTKNLMAWFCLVMYGRL